MIDSQNQLLKEIQELYQKRKELKDHEQIFLLKEEIDKKLHEYHSKTSPTKEITNTAQG